MRVRARVRVIVCACARARACARGDLFGYFLGACWELFGELLFSKFYALVNGFAALVNGQPEISSPL